MMISLSTVSSILRTEDMEGLIALGSPADEYAAEAAEIEARLRALAADQWTNAQVGSLVWEVWARAFGPFSEEGFEKRQPVLRQLVERFLRERGIDQASAPALSSASVLPQ